MKHNISICYDAVEWFEYQQPEEGLVNLQDLLWRMESGEIEEIEESQQTCLKSVRSVVVDGKQLDLGNLDIDPDIEEPDMQSGLWRVHNLKKVCVDYELDLPDGQEFEPEGLCITEAPYTIEYQIGEDGDDRITLDGEFISDQGDYDNRVFLNGEPVDIG